MVLCPCRRMGGVKRGSNPPMCSKYIKTTMKTIFICYECGTDLTIENTRIDCGGGDIIHEVVRCTKCMTNMKCIFSGLGDNKCPYLTDTLCDDLKLSPENSDAFCRKLITLHLTIKDFQNH
jgi:hypothetical protein